MTKLFISILFFITSTAFADGFKVSLGGYCPVGFAMAGKAVYGDPKYSSEHNGNVYYSSSAQAKTMFDKEPEKYLGAVKYEGYCATGLSMGKKIPSDPTLFSKADSKIYFFSSKEAKSMFDKDPKKFIGTADSEWMKIK